MWHWWLPLQHWLAIHTGTLNEPGPFYGFFSGFGSDMAEVTLIGGMAAVYRKHSCHRRWCLRFGHYDFTDEATGLTFRLCRRCHPMHPGKPLTRKHIARLHEHNHGLRCDRNKPGVTG